MPQSEGHLNPGASGLSFDRFELGDALADLVRHVWVPRWSLPPGEVRPQRVLTYPAFNVVIEPGQAALYGPDPRVQIRLLRGTSWAVGVLFRPAAGPLLTAAGPARLTGSSEPVRGAPDRQVRQVMAAGYDAGEIAALLSGWLLPAAARIDDRGMLVNQACRLAEEDHDLTRAGDLADRVGVTARSLERLVRAYTGMSPKWLIECRRLQRAATTLFTEPDTDLSALAADLGYADYPHFSRRYARALGESPRATRDDGRRAAASAAGA